MNIAIIGGGITGLVSAYYLSKKNHNITLFEKEGICGGLASGFKTNNWSWSIEKTYHHIFSNDHDIWNFSDEINFKSFLFTAPQTTSLYNYRTFPLDTPQDLLKFPLLSIPEKLRSGAVIAFLKVSPFFSFYEKQTAQEFLKRTMGEKAWIVLWEELFRKKFGKYAEKIVASFIWARIKKRTKRLRYPEGGFQNFIDHIIRINTKHGVEIKKNCNITRIEKKGKSFNVTYLEKNAVDYKNKNFDIVISTIPTPLFVKIGESLFDDRYFNKLKQIAYLSAVNLIVETNIPILDKTYWLNVCDKKIPIMCVVQHTNFIDKSHYGGNHIAYVANYVESDDWKMKASGEKIIHTYLPSLKILNPKFLILNSYLFRTPYAQPIYDKVFVKNKPEIVSPVKNLYFANLEMTYPYDRGTNYAVKLGKEVAEMI